MKTERTFVIIKPDAICQQYVGKIISRLENIGLAIERIETRRKNKIWCKRHYSHVYNTRSFGVLYSDIYSRLQVFMSNRSIIGIILSGSNAISRVRRLIGATNPVEAMPGTIRGDWGKSESPFNLVHASDSVEAAGKEIKLYFDTETDS